MKPLQRSKRREKICVCIAETSPDRTWQAMEQASATADLIELRVDYLGSPVLEPFLKMQPKPLIITNRRKEEGGRFSGDERMRLEVLADAVRLGADYVDVELNSVEAFLQGRADNKKTGLIVSFHDFEGTPTKEELEDLCDRMIELRADVVKIVTTARTWQDNLNVLSLIPYGKERSQEIVALCMGEKGRMTRVFGPLMGAAWTYSSLGPGRDCAPGQLTVDQTRDLWERLG